MVETLTESFCERCGTRYEFTAPTRLNPLRKTRGFIGGLKNYLTSQDALSDAMGDAMRTEEEQLASAQLEAFHESFNFCIDCRQYTCVNCWNDEAGRCRSCAPVPGTDDLAERLAASLGSGAGATALAAEPPETMADDEIQRRLGMSAWPTSDLPVAATNGHGPAGWPAADEAAVPSEAMAAETEVEPEPELVAWEPQPMVAEIEPEPEPEPAVAEAREVLAWEPEPETRVAEVEPEPVIAEQVESPPEPEPMRVAAWDEDAPFSVEPEPVVAEFEPEPIVAELEPEPDAVVAELEPEPIVADTEPEPDAVVAEADSEPIAPVSGPRIAPISETILRFPTRTTPLEPAPEPMAQPEPQAAEIETPEVAARRAQLDLLGLGDPGQGPVGPERPAVLPYRSRGASLGTSIRQGNGFWEASAREVAGAVAQIGVQSCGQCGLSLSASARFCRRCGTRQARSA